jgi:hypothetical protein
MRRLPPDEASRGVQTHLIFRHQQLRQFDIVRGRTLRP